MAEYTGGRGMADADHLVGLAFAAVRRAQHLEGAGVAHDAEGLRQNCAEIAR